MTPENRNPGKWRRRAAGMYLMTFMTGTLIMGSATALVSMQMAQRRITRNIADAVQTEYYAQAGLEWETNNLSNQPTWRTSRTSGASTSTSLGDAQITTTLTDTIDGDFTDDDTQPALLTVTATYNGSSVTYTSNVTPEPHEALEHNVHSFNSIDMGQTVTIEGHIYAEGGLFALAGTNATGTAKFTALDTATVLTPGLTVRRIKKSPPQPIVGLSDYIAMATSVTPNGSTEYIIDSAVFSATNGWKTTANPDGIYHIDCAGKKLTLNNIVVQGTLIITNTGGNEIHITGYGRFGQGAGGLPALLIDAPTSTVKVDIQSAIDETQISIDANEDGDQLDVLESGFFDIAWMNTSLVEIGGVTVIDGSLITNDIILRGTTVVRNNTAQDDSLIPGFTDNLLHPVEGSVREVR